MKVINFRRNVNKDVETYLWTTSEIKEYVDKHDREGWSWNESIDIRDLEGRIDKFIPDRKESKIYD